MIDVSFPQPRRRELFFFPKAPPAVKNSPITAGIHHVCVLMGPKTQLRLLRSTQPLATCLARTQGTPFKKSRSISALYLPSTHRGKPLPFTNKPPATINNPKTPLFSSREKKKKQRKKVSGTKPSSVVVFLGDKTEIAMMGEYATPPAVAQRREREKETDHHPNSNRERERQTDHHPNSNSLPTQTARTPKKTTEVSKHLASRRSTLFTYLEVYFTVVVLLLLPSVAISHPSRHNPHYLHHRMTCWYPRQSLERSLVS